MNKSERIGKICRLIEAAGGNIDSRKKIHKLIYLLQELSENFDQEYYYHNYGVFSATLASDLEDAKEIGFLNEKSNQIGGFRYELSPDIDSSDFNKVNLRRQNIRIIEELSQKSPRTLEAFSTIIYLIRNHYPIDQIRQKLLQLKPDLKPQYDEAFKLAKKYFKLSLNSY